MTRHSVLRKVALVGAGFAAWSGLPTVAAGATPQGATPAAVSWYQGVVSDLRPLQSTLVSGLQAAAAWRQGSATAQATAREIGRDLPRLVQVQGRLARLAPLPGHRGARDDYVAALGLYVAAFRLEQAATGLSPGPLVTQLQRSYERVRELGDVTFDQGTAELAPLLGASIAGPDVQAAARVPDWSALGLAPASPLADDWPGIAGTAPAPQPQDWATAVHADGAPSQSAVEKALTRPIRPAASARLAIALGRAAVSLATVPGPPGSPRTSPLARLGLLVDAEAMLSEEAGHLVSTSGSRSLARAAAALASIGGELRLASGTAH